MATPELTDGQQPTWSTSAVRVTVLLWAATAAATVLVASITPLTGYARELLHMMGLDPRPQPPTVGALLGRLSTNARVALLPLLLAAIGAARRPLTRTATDTAIFVTLTLNAALVGAALAVEGHQLLAYLPHLPLEWAALGSGAAPWLIVRQRPLHTRDWAPALAATLLLLLAAAVAETILTPHP